MLLHPLMLAWLGGAAVPLVLHLLSRSRYRAVDWGAMMFLTGVDAGTHHAARFKQWVLLLLRMGVVGLLAVALARPVVSARYAAVPTAGLTTGGSAAVVIILDDSPSMGYTANGKSRLDLAREITLQILSALKRGDQAALLLAGSRDYQPPTPPNADLQSIASKVSDLQPDLAQADFANELTRAVDLLEHAAPAEREIYLICDRQALGWRSALTDQFRQRWTARKSAGPMPRITVLPVGGDESDNVAIDAIEFTDKPVLRDQPNVLQVRVRNFGPSPAREVPIQIWTGTRTLKDTTIDVPAHSAQTVSISFRFAEAGSKVVSAAVRSTGLTSDDRLDVAVDVLEQLHVLIVNSDPAPAATNPTMQPVNPLRAALAIPDRRGSSPFVVASISSSSLTAQSLKKVDVLILDDVDRITSPQAKAIQQFTESGGGVLIVPGADIKAGDFNSALHGNGVSLLPAMLKPAVSRQAHIVINDRQNSIFRFAAGKPNPFAAVTIARFFPATPYSGDDHVIAKFTSGEPFIVDSTVNRGHVLLMTTAPDRDWSSIAQSAVFQPLMAAMVRSLGANAAVDRNLWPGQPIVAVADEPVADRSATVQSPGAGTNEMAIVNHPGDRTEMRYGKTQTPGTYRLRYKSAGKENILSFVVNPGHGQSDLTPLTQQQWKSLSNSVGFSRVDLSKITVAAAIDNQRGGREVWIDLLGGVLTLMMVEMLASRRWSAQS